MRRLLRFSVGFAIACALGTTVLWGSNPAALWCVALAVGIICLAVQRRRKYLQTAALLFLGLGAGFSGAGSIMISTCLP